MEKFFTISQTSQIVDMTTETLRHYDRIGLIKPSKTDEWTNYRYYSEEDIVCLNTIRALRCMDMSLNEIKEILQFNDFEKIANFLKESEKRADLKIAEVNYAKSKIKAARLFYESKLDSKIQKETFIKNIPQREILLSEHLNEPTLENLWNYHRHFYEQVGNKKDEFSFEDLAGIYESDGQSNLFAVCTRHINSDYLKILPQGNYLCADCTEKSRDEIKKKLLNVAKNTYGVEPKFIIQIVVLSGILKWNYQIQIYLGSN